MLPQLPHPALSLPWARPHHPANIPGECHPFACPLLLGAAAAASAQGIPSHDAWEQDGEGDDHEGRGRCAPQTQGPSRACKQPAGQGGGHVLPGPGLGPGGSVRCRLLRREVGKLPLDSERRRWRLDSMAAGATMPGGGCFPSRLYRSSISFFWRLCSASTSDRCLGRQLGSEQAGPQLSSPDPVLPILTSAGGSAARPRTPRPPHCSLSPRCSDTGCCMSSSSTRGWRGSGLGCHLPGHPSPRPLPPQCQP